MFYHYNFVKMEKAKRYFIVCGLLQEKGESKMISLKADIKIHLIFINSSPPYHFRICCINFSLQFPFRVVFAILLSVELRRCEIYGSWKNFPLLQWSSHNINIFISHMKKCARHCDEMIAAKDFKMVDLTI